MGRDKSTGADVKLFTEASLLTLGGGALMLWGWGGEDVGGLIVCGMIVGTFFWQWARGRENYGPPGFGRLLLLALLTTGTVLLFLYGR
ncbi:hypothetical protein FKR81_26710 [Lentzea tibetensis]|uniref:Uncharacterized protein n=1 Tax=Lentzea tibetensis TaxID=2591470 RepID=A0A563ENM0_9PSEU|nr:hypothetical protein [Lentzea tibetensis]TWP48887.1 hypothetical protein FKR81_26710 [Lentzea tibetensis]